MKMLNTIIKHLRYAKYVLVHKFWVMWFCLKWGIWRQGLIHDWDKFTPWKWCAYADYFCSGTKRVKKEGHFQKSEDIEKGKEMFKKAWQSHKKMQKHHWGYWIEPNGKINPMPAKYIIEMVCDWKAAGKAQGKGDDLFDWYNANYNNIKVHPLVRVILDDWILKKYADSWIKTILYDHHQWMRGSYTGH